MARGEDNRFEHGIVSLPNWLADHELSLDDDRNMIQPGDSVAARFAMLSMITLENA